LAGKGDNFGNDQLCYTSGVREWRVKDSNAMSRGIFEVNLICSNAETPHHNQILCFPKDPLIELGF
jgi:hypothetical protein